MSTTLYMTIALSKYQPSLHLVLRIVACLFWRRLSTLAPYMPRGKAVTVQYAR